MHPCSSTWGGDALTKLVLPCKEERARGKRAAWRSRIRGLDHL